MKRAYAVGASLLLVASAVQGCNSDRGDTPSSTAGTGGSGGSSAFDAGHSGGPAHDAGGVDASLNTGVDASASEDASLDASVPADAAPADAGGVGCDPQLRFSGTLLAGSNEDLEALRGVTFIDGFVTVTGAVSDLSALRCLQRVTSYDCDCDIEGDLGDERFGLSVQNTTALTSLEGLGRLTVVTGALAIRNNAALSNLEGLDRLRRAVVLLVEGNTSLASLDGLEALTTAGKLYNGTDGAEEGRLGIYITDNPALPTCEGTALRDRIGVENIDGVVSITGNDDTGVCP